MKTTLDLPDDLLQRIKLRAVRRRRKLKEEIAQLLEAGMAQAGKPEEPRKAPKPVRLRGGRRLTARAIEDAIAASGSVWGRMQDLVLRGDTAPADLASNKARLRGCGSSRRR